MAVAESIDVGVLDLSPEGAGCLPKVPMGYKEVRSSSLKDVASSVIGMARFA